MDKYTAKKYRDNMAIGLVGGKKDHLEQDKNIDLTRKHQQCADDGAAIMSMLNDLCRQVDAINPDGKNGFEVRSFVIKNLKKGLHPYAMRDGINFLIKCWKENKRKIDNPWGLALSTAKTCNQNYEPLAISSIEIAMQYGPYFTNQ
jgi:hypothetical protein